ncbi:unnamed protein product [Mortierella alpina]
MSQPPTAGYIGATPAPPTTAATPSMSGTQGQTFQNPLQDLQLSSHPRPNVAYKVRIAAAGQRSSGNIAWIHLRVWEGGIAVEILVRVAAGPLPYERLQEGATGYAYRGSRRGLQATTPATIKINVTAHTVPPHAGSTAPCKASSLQSLLSDRSDYPDNHVDSTFLEELKKNANIQHYEYWPVVAESIVITQQISSIVIFVAVFHGLHQKQLSPYLLIGSGTAAAALAYIFLERASSILAPGSNFQRRKIFKGAIFVFLTLLGLTPMLRDLTLVRNDDTVWALSTVLFLANLAFHDYDSDLKSNIKHPGSLSTNAAIFASVVLASKLETDSQVFGLLAFTVQWFALFPMVRRQLKSISIRSSIVLTLVLVLTAAWLLSSISSAIVVVYLLGMVFVTFVCPLWLIWIQRYKNKIHGPWDEARPIQRSHATPSH